MARTHSPNHRGPSAFQNQNPIPNYAKSQNPENQQLSADHTRCDLMVASMSKVN